MSHEALVKTFYPKAVALKNVFVKDSDGRHKAHPVAIAFSGGMAWYPDGDDKPVIWAEDVIVTAKNEKGAWRLASRKLEREAQEN